MKTNKDDIRALKSKHRLELVMQETGESFEIDSANPDQWHSKITPGLTVDIRRQLFEIEKPGTDIESGDVFAWLQRRYAWTFGMAIKFLEKRAPDPKQKTQPAKKAEGETRIVRDDEDKAKPLDNWQERALQIGGERMRKYFSKSWWNLVVYIDETRIEPTHAPEITICPRCEKRIEWQMDKSGVETNHGYRLEHAGPIPVIAYSIKRRLKISSLGLEGSKELETVFEEAKVDKALREKITWTIANSYDGLIDQIGALFVEEEDGVVCAKCAWDEYDFQRALELCKISAQMREEVEDEDKRQRDHAAWIMAERERQREQERMNDEAAAP